jgi:uncharacterized protein (TIGR03437 family)
MPAGVPGGAIAQGSIFSIFGSRIGPASSVTASSFPLGTSLGNVSITVSQGATTVNAIPLYVSLSQINAIMPSNAPLGTASIRVLAGNLMSNAMTVRIAGSAFGIFTATGTGLGPGVFFNYVSTKVQPINSATITAQPGQIITLYGTGLGPVASGDNVAPPSGNLPTPVQVFVGGENATVMYSGRTPCCAGLDQIVFQLPADVTLGCWVPVYVQTAGTGVSNVVTMSISSKAGGTCSDTANPLTQAIVSGQKFGAFATVRAVTHEDIGTTAAVDVTGDYSAAIAYNLAKTAFPFNPLASLPPPGTCTAYSIGGDVLGGTVLPGALPNGTPLDWGSTFTITGPSGMQAPASVFASGLAWFLGGSLSSNLIPNSAYLAPGPYTVTGMGGNDVGHFTASFTVPQPLTWTNQSQLVQIPRSQPLAISWTGGSAGQLVGVVGFGEDLPTNSSTVFACLAPPGAKSFSVPPAILTNLPATRPNILQSKSVVYLISLTPSAPGALQAPGLDAGEIISAYISGKTVVWQ